MKRICSALLAVSISTVFSGCYFHYSKSNGWSTSNLKAVTNIVESAAIPGNIKSLEVVNAFGTIRVVGADVDPAPGWSQKLTVRAKSAEVLSQIASSFICKAELTGDHLRLFVANPNISDAHSFESDLDITVPKSVSVQTRDQYGRTEITGVNGDVEARDQFGAMELRDLAGKVRAETSYAALGIGHTGPATLRNQFGAISASEIRGPLEAETSYGPLDARDIDGAVKLRNQFGRLQVEKAGEADLRTSYGELRAREINGDARMVNQFGKLEASAITGSIKAETSYGPMIITGDGTNFICDNQFGGISVRATSGALANLEARTSYAALEVKLPSSLKPAVQAHTSYGDIDSDFPVTMKSHADNSANPPGTPRVALRNQNGNIRVVRE